MIPQPDYVTYKDALVAVQKAREEGDSKYNILHSMFPDKDTTEFESEGVKFFSEYYLKHTEARVRRETAKEIKVWILERDKQLVKGRMVETGYILAHYNELFLSEGKK